MSQSLPNVGFVGLGKMGRPMTQRLLATGYPAHVFNRSRGAVDALAHEGATPADSAREVAERADVILTALPTPESVESVYAEMAEAARSGQIYADHSTVKLINQLLVGIHTAAIAEAAVFGARLGADPQVVLDLIGTSFGGSTMMTRHMPRFISRDFSGATPVGLILKDLGLIHDEARASGVPLYLGAFAEQRFSEAFARGQGADDMAALVRLWEEPAGVTVDRPSAVSVSSQPSAVSSQQARGLGVADG